MGIHDRDYYRDGGRGRFDAFGRHGATVWIIGITVGVYFAQLVSGFQNPHGVTALGIYDPRLILQGEVWRLLTAVFLHSERPLHVIFNMFVLYWVGLRLEDKYGSREFVLFYLTAGVAANLVTFLLQTTDVLDPRRALGASGAVTAALILYAFNWPRQRILLFFVLPVPMFVAALLFVIVDTFGMFGVGEQGIGYSTHLGGAAFGAAYFEVGLRLSDLLPSWSGRAGRRAQPRLRVVPSEPEERSEPVGAAVEAPSQPPSKHDEHFEARVDAVLEKVARHGQESLTTEERELLFRASEVYKKKRK